MNGSTSDSVPGLSLGPRSTGSDILVLSPNSMGGQSISNNIQMAMANMNMSLETLGLDMSLEEAVNKVRDLTKENAELRENVQQNNMTMKQQYQILTDWKNKWEEEREQVRQKHEKARNVVTNLRGDVKNKEEEIRRLEMELIQYEQKANHTAPSVQAELMGLEQIKDQLEKRCVDYRRQIMALNEDIQSVKNMRDDQSTENDKYIKIVTEKEEKIGQLEQSNVILKTQVEDMHKIKETHDRLEEQKKVLVTENRQLMQQVQHLRQTYQDDIDQGVADMSMQSGFVHISVDDEDDEGSVVSDSVPFETTYPQTTKSTPPKEAVQSAAVPMFPEASKAKVVTMEVQNDPEEHSMGDVLLQLRDERNKVHDLLAENQQKNQELEALHRKVHSTEELLAEKEHKLNVDLTRRKLESEQREELLRGELEQARRKLQHSQSTPPHPHNSQHVFQCEEDNKTLKIQVTSLVGELTGVNDRNRSLEELCHKQKDRLQNLEAKVQSQHDDLEIQRAKDDELMETLRLTIVKQENQLAGQRSQLQLKEVACERLSKEYGHLFQQYQEMAKQNEAFKKELQQRMSQSLVQDTSRNYQEQIDNLTAQLITAEESMHEMKQENSKLKDRLQQMGGEVDMVEVLRAQAEVYRTDFEAERKSREKLHEEKEVMKEENNQLHLRNQQLQEELSHLSENQIAEMQRRHSQRGFASQLRSVFLGGHDSGSGGGDYVNLEQRENPRFPGNDVPPPLPPPRQEAPREGYPMQHQGGQGSPRQGPSEDPADPQFVCPMCGEQSPDIDTLQLHVIDCIR